MIKLLDILWEITPECNRSCKYCGSKQLKNKKQLAESSIKAVLKEIVKYPPKSITLTGGEPGMLTESLLHYVISELTAHEIKVSVVTNGLFAEKMMLSDFADEIWIGHSINDSADNKLSTELMAQFAGATMITNFGTHNIWQFDELYKKALEYNYWQIQLTMGEFLLPPSGIEFLRHKIKGADDKNIVLADNLQNNHTCMAGMNSCSILYNGRVVPCVSERCYIDTEELDEHYIQGNLLSRSLKDIWENEFKDQRFGGKHNKCCRDFINYPKADDEDDSEDLDNKYIIWPMCPRKEDDWPETPYPHVYMYGVFPQRF